MFVGDVYKFSFKRQQLLFTKVPRFLFTLLHYCLQKAKQKLTHVDIIVTEMQFIRVNNDLITLYPHFAAAADVETTNKHI